MPSVYVRFAPPTVWRAVCRRPSSPEMPEQAALEDRLYAPPGNPSSPSLGQGKEAAVRPHHRSDFFVDARWLVVSFSQKRFSLQMITHLKKAHPVAYG